MRNPRAVAWILLAVLSTSISCSLLLGTSHANSVRLSEPLGTSESWPMFRNDLNHSGYSTSTAPDIDTVLWQYTTGSVLYSCPAVAYGMVYLGAEDKNVYALNSSTGALVWNYTTGDYVFSSPAVADGRVFIGSWDHNVYALNASTGELIWNYTTGDNIESSPAVAGGVVFVGSDDHNVYALDASTGNHIWNYTTGSMVESSPAIANGKVYVGSYDKRVYCLDASTGSQTWNYTTGDQVYSSPAVAYGEVYVGSDDGSVYALDASTGLKLWNYTTGGHVWSSPAVANGMVYVGSNDDHVYALDASTGVQIWNFTTQDWVQSSPAVADGKVFVGSHDSAVYALNASTGVQVWRYFEAARVLSSPAVADGTVYVSNEDGKVYAIGSPAALQTATMSVINPLATDKSASNRFDFNSSLYPVNSTFTVEIHVTNTSDVNGAINNFGGWSLFLQWNDSNVHFAKAWIPGLGGYPGANVFTPVIVQNMSDVTAEFTPYPQPSVDNTTNMATLSWTLGMSWESHDPPYYPINLTGDGLLCKMNFTIAASPEENGLITTNIELTKQQPSNRYEYLDTCIFILQQGIWPSETQTQLQSAQVNIFGPKYAGVPEFSTLQTLLFLTIATTAIALICKRKLRHAHSSRNKRY